MLKGQKILSKRWKGGSVPTVDSIPAWARPYIEAAAGQTQNEFNIGNLGNVADTNPLLQTAFGSGAQAIGDTANRNLGALTGQQTRLEGMATQGAYDPAALKDKAILEADMKTAELGRRYGAGGTLGSARQMVEMGANNAATRAQFATIDRDMFQQNFENRLRAEQGIGANVQGSTGVAEGAAKAFSSLGAQARGIEQESGDAAWQALQRYASTTFGNPARQQQQAGGK
jgi:hypothetical protein